MVVVFYFVFSHSLNLMSFKYVIYIDDAFVNYSTVHAMLIFLFFSGVHKFKPVTTFIYLINKYIIWVLKRMI